MLRKILLPSVSFLIAGLITLAAAIGIFATVVIQPPYQGLEQGEKRVSLPPQRFGMPLYSQGKTAIRPLITNHGPVRIKKSWYVKVLSYKLHVV